MIVGALAGLMSAHPVQGQEPLDRVTLEQATSLFTRHNLQLRIARADAQEAMGLARQSAAYPNPTVSVTHETLGGGTADYDETYFNLSQPFEWPWLSSARRAQATRMAEALGARVAADSTRLVFEMKRAFIEAAAAELTRDALEEATALVRRAEGQAAVRATAGDLSEYELRRLRVERARYEVDLAAATLALRASRRTLASMIAPDSLSEIAPVSLPGAVPLEHRVEGRARHSAGESAGVDRRSESDGGRPQRPEGGPCRAPAGTHPDCRV